MKRSKCNNSVEDIRDRIKILRTSLRLTQAEFGEKINVADSTITNWELRGKIPQSKIVLISRVFGVNQNWLETGDGDMFATSDPVKIETPYEFAIRYGCDQFMATIFERVTKLNDEQKRMFSEILQIVFAEGVLKISENQSNNVVDCGVGSSNSITIDVSNFFNDLKLTQNQWKNNGNK